MSVIVVDTETTGLIENYRESLYNTSKYPHVVQLSWLVYNSDTGKIDKICDYILKVPDHIIISEECSNIHGITNEISKKKGREPKEILQLFVNDFKNATLCVCHNVRFDKRMLRIELIRNNFTDYIYKGKSEWYCTMENSIDICKIDKYNKYTHARKMLERCRETITSNPSNMGVDYLDELSNLVETLKSGEKEYYKRPKLIELHEHLFKTTPNNLHNSLVDVVVCFRCWYLLRFFFVMFPCLFRIRFAP